MIDDNAIERAIAEGEVCLHYQPVVNLRTRRVAGYEALARWKTPQGLRMPWEFVDRFDASPHLERWLRAQMQELNAALPMLEPHQWLAVNLSSNALALPSLENVLSTFADRRRLRLEVSEQVWMTRGEQAVLEEIHLSYHLSADDFGSAVAWLARLAVPIFDSVKMDGSMIKYIMTGGRRAKLIAAVTLELIEGLQMSAIAEWVENEEQARFLEEYGCEMAQGDLFGKPEPISHVVDQN